MAVIFTIAYRFVESFPGHNGDQNPAPQDIHPLLALLHQDGGVDKQPASDQKKLSVAISAVEGAISVHEPN